MKKLDKLRELAVRLRKEGLALDDIAKHVGRHRCTVRYWIRDIPLAKRTAKQSAAQQARADSNKQQAQKRRSEAYERGVQEWPMYSAKQWGREFVMLYLTEGYRKSRSVVSVANSDSSLLRLAVAGLRMVSSKPLNCEVRIYQDHNVEKEKRFWAKTLGLSLGQLSITVKNTGGLLGRSVASLHGCVIVRVHDTLAKSYVDGLCDGMRNEINQAMG